MIKNDKRVIDLTISELQELLGEAIKNSTSSLNQSQPELQDLVPIDGAIEITNLARQTIYGLVCERKIPFIKR